MKAVRVVPHDPKWRDDFAAEAMEIALAMGESLVAVHHIGSTSIAGIYAKPVIDILVEVTRIEAVGQHYPAMRRLGYEVMGEFGIAGRRYFRKDGKDGIRTHQIHTFEAGSAEAKRHIAFRDFLDAHPDEARKYSDLKRALAAEHPNDIDAYIDGKDRFIKETDRLAAIWQN